MTREQVFEFIQKQKTAMFTALKCRVYKDLRTEWIDL